MNFADAMNLGCACQTLETPRLQQQLETEPALAGLTARLAQSHPHLFSRSAVFLDPGVMAQITDAVAALERVIALPAWQQQALDRAPRSPGSTTARPVSSWVTTSTWPTAARA